MLAYCACLILDLLLINNYRDPNTVYVLKILKYLNKFRLWRKNRSVNPESLCLGTDLNRNFGYQWGVAGSRRVFSIVLKY